MESLDGSRNAAQHPVRREEPGQDAAVRRAPRRQVAGQDGIALVMALIITLVAFLVVASTLYLVSRSVTMSGAGKTYATADEAADGTLDLLKEYINAVNFAEDDLPNIFTSPNCQEGIPISQAIISFDISPCTLTLDLPAVVGASYTANVTLQRMGLGSREGNPIFPEKKVGRGGGVPILYRILVHVENRATGASAENVAVYRFVSR